MSSPCLSTKRQGQEGAGISHLRHYQLAVTRSFYGIENSLPCGCTRFAKQNATVLADHDDAARNPAFIVVQRAILAGNVHVLINQKWKREAVLLAKLTMIISIIRINADWLHIVSAD